MAFRVLGTKVEWVAESERPPSGDALVVPANDHLWMLNGPGLELKKALGKDVEIEAVRQGPVEPGAVVVTSGSAMGYRHLFHAVVMGQNLDWIPGSGRTAMEAVCDRARQERVESLVAWPLYRGVKGRREPPAEEMLSGLLAALEAGSNLKGVSVLYADAEEKSLLHQTFLRLLSAPH